MRLTVMTGIFLTTMSAASSAQETLNGEQLSELIDRVRSFEPRDQFDTPPTQPSIAGKRFSYTVEPHPIGTKTNCAGYPEWVWLAQQGKLNISWSPTLALTYTLKGRNGPPFPPNLFGIRNSELMVRSFTCSKTNEPSYMANNAFGAQFSVEKTSEVVNAIADIDQLASRRPSSSWEALVSGDAARQLSANVRVRVSGTLSDWWPGVSVVCGQKQLQPTIRVPLDRITDMCLIRGQVERVDVVDQRSGAVLHSVAREPQRARARR